MNDVVPTGSTEAPPGLGLKQYLDGLAQYLRGERARFARWVIAGIVRVDTRYSGVWYLTLVDAEQSDAGHGDKVTASAAVRRVPGTGLADPLIFDAEQGPLRVGQKVLVKVAPGLSRAGRLSLDILDIDTTYTLGELTVREIETRRRLQADGLYAANRTLPAPRTIQRIAVIAPQASQGFEDFRTSLAECEAFGFVQIVAVDAVFQGERAKASIPAAFATVGAQGPFDIVFLVRGGGDARDLAVLSEYEVAAAVCACPFPVWTGIGHEQDNVVAQEVAQRAFGTPSKAAEALANRYAAGGKRLVNALEALAQHGARLAAAEAQHLRASQRRLRQRGADLADRDRQHLATLAGRIGRAGRGSPRANTCGLLNSVATNTCGLPK